MIARVARALVAVAAAVAFTVVAQGEYYPFHAGARWVYSNGEVQELSGPKTVNGASVLVLAHSNNAKVTTEDYLTVRNDGVLLNGSRTNGQLVWYSPPLTVYPAAPLQVGARWSSSTRLGNSVVALTARVLSNEGVVTPAGRFNALLIRTSVTTSSGAASVVDAYFVPAVGTVRFVTQDGSTVDLVSR